MFFKVLKRFTELRKERRRRNKAEKNKPIQYTKILVTCLSIMACLWISTSYVLASFSLFLYGNTDPLSNLSQQVCITIIGVVVSYCIKSFCESFSEAKSEFEYEKMQYQIIQDVQERGYEHDSMP